MATVTIILTHMQSNRVSGIPRSGQIKCRGGLLPCRERELDSLLGATGTALDRNGAFPLDRTFSDWAADFPQAILR